jgi:apolipoprotein N-acyltransferase
VNFVFALISAALLILSLPNFDWHWLAPIALTPLMVAAVREKRGLRRFLVGYAAGVVYWFAVCNWIEFTLQTHAGMSPVVAWLVFLLFCLAKALQMGAFAWAAGWMLPTRFGVPATAALWVAIEWTHGPLGFAWLTLGNAGIDIGPFLNLAPWTGVWGLSFLFAALAAEIANLILRRPAWPFFGVAFALAVLLLPKLPGAEPGRQRATLVQPNIDEEQNWTPQAFAALVERMRVLSIGHPSPLLVWPEAPAPFYESDPTMMRFLSAVARDQNREFLAGIIGNAADDGNLNSAVLFDRYGHKVSRYDKVNLVPFGEFVPWPLGPIAFKVSHEAGDFESGTQDVVSQVAGHKIGTFVCYESVFPRFIRRFVADGAELLVNPSNDGWFGKTHARFQHLAIVRMRAAENRRWILRATNDGISAAIDDAGRVRERLPLYEEAAGTVAFSYEDGLTLYTRWGDWFPALCALGVLANYAGLLVRRRP